MIISSVEDLLRKLKWRDNSMAVFRGHSDASYKLMSSLGRYFLPFQSMTFIDFYSSLYDSQDGSDLHQMLGFGKEIFDISAEQKTIPSIETFERVLIQLFRQRFLAEWQTLAPESELDWLALAQHHGLPTRLLDWTHNPLIALYFTVRGGAKDDCDGMFFTLFSSQGFPAPNSLDLKDITRPTLFEPRLLNSRIINQQGCFVICDQPAKPLIDARPDTSIAELRVPAEAKPEIRKQLHLLGITEDRLFADPDGLARAISWHISLRLRKRA